MSPRKFLPILMLGWAIGAMCAGLVSGTLTLIKSDLNLTNQQAGVILSSWSFGMLIGAFLFGFIADRIGRRYSLQVTMLLIGVFTSLSSAASGLVDLSFYRIVAGAANAGYMVVASTLMSEYAPAMSRGRYIAVLESSWALGWLLSLVLARVIAPLYGWRQVFLSALVALPLTLVFYFMIPESLRFLVMRGRVEEAKRLSEKLGMPLPPPSSKTGSLSEILRPPYLQRTIMLWIHWFAIALTYWGIFLWLPDILKSKGLDYAKSLEFAIIITLAQIPGYISAAYLVEKVGRKPVLAGYMFLAGVSSVGVFLAGSQTDLLVWGSLVSMFNLGAWGITYAYTPELYPTRLRGTGSGWANSFGRIGGIVGPYIAGALIQTFNDPLVPFTVFAAMHLVSATVVYLLGVETKGLELEEISP